MLTIHLSTVYSDPCTRDFLRQWIFRGARNENCIPVARRSSLGHIQVAVPILESCWSAISVSVWHLKLDKPTNEPTSQPLNLSTNQLQTWVMHEHRSQSLLLSLSTLCRQSPGPTGASSATSKEDASMLQFHQGTSSVTLKIHGTFLCMNITGWMMNASSTEFLSLFATLLLKWWRPPERWVNWKLLPHLSSQKPDLGRLPQTRHRWISDGGDHATSLIRDGFKN